jgi:hypothetical protein
MYKKMLVGKPYRKRPPGRPNSTYSNIKWILEKHGVEVESSLNRLRIGSNGGIL